MFTLHDEAWLGVHTNATAVENKCYDQLDVYTYATDFEHKCDFTLDVQT